MAVVLKNQVVDQLRASRSADDAISRIQENSLEQQRKRLVSLVESPNWRFGPAELLATFPHHLVAKDPAGNVVQVEWSMNSETGKIDLGRAAIFESSVPVADLGHEVMETAKAAVDKIIGEDYDGSAPMIASIAEALDAGGDLQRQINTEVTMRSLTRDAWWHTVVGLREGIEDGMPSPIVEDAQRSATDLLVFLKEQASSLATTARQLDGSSYALDVEALARDIAEDVGRAISALLDLDRRNTGEVVQVYEAVVSATPQLLNGIAFLNELTETTDETLN
jgi:hypothetical protein